VRPAFHGNAKQSVGISNHREHERSQMSAWDGNNVDIERSFGVKSGFKTVLQLIEVSIKNHF
jgi:hypothetical protein